SIIVLMAMVTSLMAPPALRFTLRHVEPEQQELDRLRQEELTASSMVAKIHRVLIPLRERETASDIHGIEAYLIGRFHQRSPLSVTLFTVAAPGDKARATAFLERLRPRFPGVEL